MAENYSKSKLKRKKSSVDELQLEKSPRGAAKRSSWTSLIGDDGAKTVGSELPAAAAWWETRQPPAVESLWAFTLKSALPYLQNQRWDPVPDLPLPPAAKPAAADSDGWRWCDVRCDVPPLPESSLLSLKPPLSPDPPGPASSPQDLSVQTKPAAKPPDRTPDLLIEAPQQLLNRRQQEKREEAASTSSARGPSVGEEEEEETGAVGKEIPTEKVKVSAEEEEEEEGEEGEQRVRRDEEAALQSCPMCLQVFPAGFTQMERDGHLAQCLSEMNVDMTW